MDALSLETRGFDHNEVAVGRAPVKSCVTQYWRHKAATGYHPNKNGLAGLEVTRPDQLKEAEDKALVDICGSPRGFPPSGLGGHTRSRCRLPTDSGAKLERALQICGASGERVDATD